MFRLFSLLIGYALGHIQTAYILGKAVKKIDIRNYGSGNAGMTNAARVMGGKMAAIVLLVDVMKAVGAYILCSAIFGGAGSCFSFEGWVSGSMAMSVLPGCYGAVGAILGHMFPAYMRFKGGKSVAAGIGFILALDFRAAGLILVTAMLIILITKFVSAASITALVMLPFVMLLFGFETEAVLIGVFLAILMIYKHKANIQRLLKGTENKIGKKIGSKEEKST